MSSIATYNPLSAIWLPDVEITAPQGLIVVVGPNSSGKTLFLRDIENYLLTGIPDFVVCQGLSAERPADFDAFVEDLIQRSYLKPVPTQEKRYWTYVSSMKERGRNDQVKRPQFSLKDLNRAFAGFSSDRGGANPGWFASIGMTLVALLSLDQRRSVCNRVRSFDHTKGAPDHPVQGLHINSKAQERLAEETGAVFGNAVWLDISENGYYQLRTSGSHILPPRGDMNNPLLASAYRPIESEGDGYRSYVGVCLSLLLATRPVSLIDEPELCLHPPQSYRIGRFIGENALQDHVTIVATHSSHVLRGILETCNHLTVVRLSRQNKQFRAKLISDQELLDNLRNPRTRAESVLDGLFSKAVVLVESEGDREEYQAASEAISGCASREVHFVPVGGTGGFAEVLRFYRSLEIPAAIIADLDAICDTDKIAVLARQLFEGTEQIDEVTHELRDLVSRIRSLPPSISESEASETLKHLAEERLVWANGGDNVLRRKLNELEDRLRRIQRLKKGGIGAYKDQPEIYSALNECVSIFALAGLFLVPVGELEHWVPSLMEDVSKKSMSKTARAAVAANRIREAECKSGDIWEFVQKVFEFLRTRCEDGYLEQVGETSSETLASMMSE